jgi:hypothetical protein
MSQRRPNTRSRGRVDSDISTNTPRTEERRSHGQPPRNRLSEEQLSHREPPRVGPLDSEPGQSDGERPVDPLPRQPVGERPVDPEPSQPHRERLTDPESSSLHNPALNVGDTPTITSSLGQTERLAQLEREVTARRVAQRIQELEQELAEGPAIEDTIGGISHTKCKRNADREDENLYRYIKFSEAPIFGEKNQKEFHDFI